MSRPSATTQTFRTFSCNVNRAFTLVDHLQWGRHHAIRHSIRTDVFSACSKNQFLWGGKHRPYLDTQISLKTGFCHFLSFCIFTDGLCSYIGVSFQNFSANMAYQHMVFVKESHSLHRMPTAISIWKCTTLSQDLCGLSLPLPWGRYCNGRERKRREGKGRIGKEVALSDPLSKASTLLGRTLGYPRHYARFLLSKTKINSLPESVNFQ